MTNLAFFIALAAQDPGIACDADADCNINACEFCGADGTCATCPLPDDGEMCHERICLDYSQFTTEGLTVCTGVEGVPDIPDGNPLATLCGNQGDQGGLVFFLPIEPIAGGAITHVACAYRPATPSSAATFECGGEGATPWLSLLVGPGFCAGPTP